MGNKGNHGEIKYKHFYFNEVIKKEVFREEFITITRPIMNEGEYQDWRNIYDQALQMNKDALFLPTQAEHRKIKNAGLNCCCGADSEIQMTFANFNYLFQTELINRMNKATYFSEGQLTYMFYKLLEGAKEFQIMGKSIGDIRPKNIVYPMKGDMKMINLASFPWEHTAIDKILDGFDTKTKFYLSPEQVRFLTSAAGRNKLPNPKTEAWSIGLTVLESALLESSEDLYAMPSRQINMQLIQQRLEKVRSKYPVLHRYLAKALEQSSERRQTSGQIWASLKCYSERITELKSFQPDNSREADAIQSYHRHQSIH